MAMPVVAAVLTTIAAFVPLGFIQGRIGDFLAVLPVVMIAALSVSIVEAFLILPSHLAHRRDWGLARRWPRLAKLAERIAQQKHRAVEVHLRGAYERLLRLFLRWRYPVLAGVVAAGLIIAGLIEGGIIPFVLLQETDAETITATLEMAAGTSQARTTQVVDTIARMAKSMPEVESVFSVVGSAVDPRGQESAADPSTVGQLTIELLPADYREAHGLRNSVRVVSELRRQTAAIPGIKRISFIGHHGGITGPDIEIRVRSEDLATLRAATRYVRRMAESYEGVYEVHDDMELGKLEAQLRLRETGRLLGLTTRDLALQLRHALYGFEVQRLQGEDEEIRVRVLLPKSARRDLADLFRLRIVTPSGGRVPLEEVAAVSTARGYATLSRADGRRAATVTAEVDEDVANVAEITSDLAERLADIGERFQGVSVRFEGSRRETTESLSSLKIGFPLALLAIYAIIAALFRSYVQPLIVMTAIPFSFIGAALGHLVMGYPFTILSMIGGVALAGIVVNDSLILVDLINRLRRSGTALLPAVIEAGRARLRPIILTSVTTMAGLGPLMLERSFQATFLIPMAISIVFGLAFSTVLTLLVLPTFYLIMEDARWLLFGAERADWSSFLAAEPDA